MRNAVWRRLQEAGVRGLRNELGSRSPIADGQKDVSVCSLRSKSTIHVPTMGLAASIPHKLARSLLTVQER